MNTTRTVPFEIDAEGHHVRACARCGAKKTRAEMNGTHCNGCRRPRGRKRAGNGAPPGQIGLCAAVARINAATGLRLSRNALHDLMRRGKCPVPVTTTQATRYFLSEDDLAKLVEYFRPAVKAQPPSSR